MKQYFNKELVAFRSLFKNVTAGPTIYACILFKYAELMNLSFIAYRFSNFTNTIYVH